MLSTHFKIVDDDFRVGFRFQKAWGVSMASAFFFGEAGAGLYFVAQFFDFALGMSVGLLMVLMGKGGGHLLHLGRPSRGWRAFTRIGSSWISRGLLAISVFTVFGTLHVFDLYTGLLPHATSWPVAAVAVAACLTIMVYQGFAMSHSSSIALWSTGLMPLASLTYALLNGVVLTLVLGFHAALFADRPEMVQLLRIAAVALILYGVVTILSLLHGAKYGSEGGQESVRLLLRGAFRNWFLALVIGLGFGVSALMMAFAPEGFAVMIAAAGAELTGYYAFRVLMFRAATYDPVMSFAPHFRG
ncbi:MAG: dimethyl sulfoxide reductase anchor subunit [Burkholderiaceae bacterium]|nr:dimethyl sulfoxide reductase anchor subunit [Burkholderiaceae bacterium]